MRCAECLLCIEMACSYLIVVGGISYAGDDDPVIDEKPLSQLIKQLRSENRGFQLRAAQALAKAPAELCPKIVPSLIPLLKSERENDRFVAAQTLGNYGPAARAAVPELLPVLEGTQYERNRAAAAKALGQILKDAPTNEEVEKVTDALIRKIDADYDKYSDVRREAVTALGMIGPAAKKCVPKLVRAMTEANQFGSSQDQEYRLVRRATAWTCGRMGPLAKEQVDRLIAMMHAEGGYVTESVEALGLMGPIQENIVPNIMDRIESYGRPGDWAGFKVKAFEALGRCGAKSAPAVPMIRRMLRDTGGDDAMPVKIAMVKCLADIGQAAKEAAPEILSHIQIGASQGGDPYKTLKEESVKAYKAVAGQEPPADKK